MNMRNWLVTGALLLPVAALVILSQSSRKAEPPQALSAPLPPQTSPLRLSQNLPKLPDGPRVSLADEVNFYDKRLAQLEAMTDDDWLAELGAWSGKAPPNAPTLDQVRDATRKRLAQLKQMTEADWAKQKKPLMSIAPAAGNPSPAR